MPLNESRNLRLDVELSNTLDTVAKRKGMNASQVMRLALMEFMSREIRLSNEQHHRAVELSNPATSPDTTPTEAQASDADLVGHWEDFYGTDLRRA